MWLFILKGIGANTKKSVPQLHQLHFKPSVASGCCTGRPSSTGLMICSLGFLSKGTFFLTGFLVRFLLITFQIPSVTFKPLGLVVLILPRIQLLPVCSPLRHILHSFIAFNLSLSLQNTAHCLYSPAHSDSSSGTLHWLSGGISSHYTPVLVATPVCGPCESADGPYHALLSLVYHPAAGGVAMFGDR